MLIKSYFRVNAIEITECGLSKNGIFKEGVLIIKLSVLLSAMYLESYTYIESLNIVGDCVVVNQCDSEFHKNINDNSRQIYYIETTERGLSKSRNMAIRHATGDVWILCDNDVEYIPGYEQLILEQYEKHPEYDGIVFHVESPINPVPCFPTERRLNYLSSGKVISYEISFRRDRVQGIQFDELIGAGTRFKMGEENAFLYECLRRGLHIHYIPIRIAKLRYEPSTWDTGFDREYMIGRGASFDAMTDRWSWALILQFALRKYKRYRENLKFTEALSGMLEGRRLYREAKKGSAAV